MSDSKKRSEVWKHFTTVNDEKAKCGLCNKFLSYDGGGTGNLSRHLKLVHKKMLTPKIIYVHPETYDVSLEDHIDESSNFVETSSIQSTSQSQNGNATNNIDSNRFIPSKIMKNSKNRKSEIWKHFEIVGKLKAKCGHCDKTLSFAGGATGNLSRHLRLVHKSIHTQEISYVHLEKYDITMVDQNHEDLNIPDVPNITFPSTCREIPIDNDTKKFNSISFIPSHVETEDAVTSLALQPTTLGKNKKLDEQLIRFLVKEYHTFGVAEETEFKNFVYMLCPSYKMPDSKTISNNLIPTMYSNLENELKSRLLDIDAACLTLEKLKLKNNQIFIAVTVHFIDGDTGRIFLKSNLLGCFPLNKPHFVNTSAQHLKRLTDEFALTNKISCIVSDNVGELTKAITMNNWKFFPCFAHTLNWVLQNAIDEIKVQVGKVRSIAQFFESNSCASSKLRNVQKEMKLPDVGVKLDVLTRWNSTYHMISRILIIKDAIVRTLTTNQPNLNTLLTDDWNILKKAVQILKFFSDITEEIVSEKSVPISKAILFVNSMKKHLRKFQIDNEFNTLEVSRLLTKLISGIEEKFKNVELHELATQATFLDPRFKKYGFSSEATYESTFKSIQSEIAYLATESSSESVNTTASSTVDHSKAENKSAIWEDFDNSVENVLNVENKVAKSRIEIDKYINEPLIRRTEDPLEWWEERISIYPRLYKLMRKRMCIVATSVTGENIFSKAAETLVENRRQLAPDEARNILFLNHNL